MKFKFRLPYLGAFLRPGAKRGFGWFTWSWAPKIITNTRGTYLYWGPFRIKI